MNNSNIKGFVIVAFAILFATFSFYFYQIFYAPNFFVDTTNGYIYVEEDDNFKSLLRKVTDEKIVTDPLSFAFLSKVMKYQENVKPGRYAIKANSTNLEVVRLLRSGEQAPVTITFNNIRTKEQLAPIFCEELSCSALKLDSLLGDSAFVSQYGFDTLNVISLFIPNTYEFMWNTSSEKIFSRMKYEFDKFWDEERLNKAKAINLNPKQVSILASIVESETKFNDEKPRVAGVYINRLKRGMLLQADPTVVFAIGDFTKKRILKKDTEFDSPYNTYKYLGLPPGPIRGPEISSIDAVLNPEQHKYLYFCAKEDFSGYHNFSRTHTEHINNARRYQRALNQQGILK